MPNKEHSYTIELEDGSTRIITASNYNKALGRALELARQRETRIVRIC